MAEVLRTIPLQGFDTGGEPTIQVMSDGSLEVWFEYMPPSDAERGGTYHLGEFEGFDREMAVAIGVPVVWEDREFFRIEIAPPGTLERVQRFVEGYRNRS